MAFQTKLVKLNARLADMPVTMPNLPKYCYFSEEVNVTFNQVRENEYLLVFSRFGENGMAEFLGLTSLHWDNDAHSSLEKSFASSGRPFLPVRPDEVPDFNSIIDKFAKNPPRSPIGYLEQFTVAAGRSLFTGHLIVLRGFDLEYYPQRPPRELEFTTLWFEELQNWGETSAAYVLSNMYETPIATIHSRIRLAKRKGLLEGPGKSIRRHIK